MAICRPNDNEIRIVLLGKTGAGKSSLGNSLLGAKTFKTKGGASSMTSTCTRGCVLLPNGKTLMIVDTPGLYDTARSNEETSIEISRCVVMTAPGVHAFILVLQIGRFTEEELDTIKKLQTIFGDRISNHAFVVFTRKDNLDADDQTLEEFIQESPQSLQRLLRQCGMRYVAVNNRSNETRKAHMDKVIELIYQTMANHNGGFYSEEIFQEAEREVQKRMMEREVQKRMMEREVQKRMMEKEAQIQIMETNNQQIQSFLNQAMVPLDPGTREEIRREIEFSNGMLSGMSLTVTRHKSRSCCIL